jgi:dihydrofolate synthase / folylpolyglutamate synthase
MFKDFLSGFEWITSLTNLEKKPDLSKRGYRLDRMYALLDLFNNPQNNLKLIHLAGSKGKGSTATFLSSILSEKGFKVGLYTSPHLIDYRERITLNHRFFPEAVYIEGINLIKNKLDNINITSLPGGEPTTFEVLTLLSFIIFNNQNCQWAVIETGIGGKFDSTNVITPEASVITPIELEHCEILGNTIEEITLQKAGIIKRGKPVFTSNTKPEVLEILKNVSYEKDAPFYVENSGFKVNVTPMGTELEIDMVIYKPGLKGGIQGQNAFLATKVIKKLFPETTSKELNDGLEKAFIPGRFQICQNIVLDGAHTKDSILDTVKTFKSIFNEGIIIFGAIKGKNIEEMAKIISKNFSIIIISTPGYFKESSIEDVTNIFSKYSSPITISDPGEALNYGLSLGKPILVTGSFYMAGEIGKIILPKD